MPLLEAQTLPLTLSQRSLLAELSAQESNAAKQKKAAMLAIVAGVFELSEVATTCSFDLNDAGITVTPKG